MITPRYISELLGAPMAAVIQAEAIAAKATANFIKEVGFMKATDASDPDFGAVRTITFSYQRINADGTTQTATLAIPLLTIIPIPSLQVAEAEIEFDLALTQPEVSTKSASNSGSLDKTFLNGNDVRLRAIFGKKPSANPNAPASSTTANMNVKIKLAQADLAVGMIQLLNILDSSNKET